MFPISGPKEKQEMAMEAVREFVASGFRCTASWAMAPYSNDIGAAQLLREWSDPQVSAIHYARVLEIPTPRWSTYLPARNGLPVSEDVPSTIQECAWTSPIFYGP